MKNKINYYFFGFSKWKHSHLKKFYKHKKNVTIKYCNTLTDLINEENKNTSRHCYSIYIWGMKNFPEVLEYAKNNNIHINRIEDGFIRSNTLGSNLTNGYSIIEDSKGIYFNPNIKSKLDFMLEQTIFNETTSLYGKKIINTLIHQNITKYNLTHTNNFFIPNDKNIVVVIGQVEDDASIQYGALSIKSNLDLLKSVYNNKKENDYIIYKPHPDVESGNRIGDIPNIIAINYCNNIASNVSITDLLSKTNELHTITSLTGLEAVIRGIDTYIYGNPFYAGYGFTNDKEAPFKKNISLFNFIFISYYKYPKYLNPETEELCDFFEYIEALKTFKHKNNIYSNIYSFYKRLKNLNIF